MYTFENNEAEFIWKINSVEKNFQFATHYLIFILSGTFQKRAEESHLQL